ncbi:hypothetical protein L484_002302 [Morus notabilis]|uniref:Uncharacterized protein n=1 Tax=Morus notabilis TaxID=981085 RepID=W9R2N1_9ROSA|nr:hypothetical protein L484_002302 [Morus notabilis]
MPTTALPSPPLCGQPIPFPRLCNPSPMPSSTCEQVDQRQDQGIFQSTLVYGIPFVEATEQRTTRRRIDLSGWP